MSFRYIYILLSASVFYTSSAYALTHKEAATKKSSYLSQFKDLTGALTVEDGVLYIHKNLRVQANKTFVENTSDLGMKLVAHGNVMVNYRGKTFVCDHLEYYENTDTCVLTNGRFAMYPWFLGGASVMLSPETLIIHKGYISTSEGPRKDLCLSGDYLEYSSDGLLSIGKTTLKLCNIPLMLLPPFSIMPMEIPKPPINFRGGSGGFLGSYLGISYSPIAKSHFSSTFFLDSFFKHGIGVGYNMHFSQKETPENTFNLMSYYAHRLAIDMPKTQDRYRLHGDFAFSHKQTHFYGEYHLSDSWETVADIFPNNFVLKNTGPTKVSLSWRGRLFESTLTSSFKVNSFQSVNQELPYFTLRQFPLQIPKIKLFLENTLECGYLDYAFGNQIPGKDFSSLRVASTPKIYRSIPLPIGVFTPSLSGSVIYYSHLPETSSQHYQASGKLSLDYRFLLYKSCINKRHILEPFITIAMYSRPLAKNNEHYIFSIQDAFHELNLIQIGVKSSFYHKLSLAPYKEISAKIWTTHIMEGPHAREVFPKTSGVITLPLGRRSLLSFDTEWIWKKHCWDHLNARWQWVGNENLALEIEALHRSKYSLMKCDRENFILDVSYPIEKFFHTPLTDRRNLILGKLFFRLHPLWNYRLALRYGWHRTDTPNYLEYQMVLGTKVFEHWQLYTVYERREADTRFFFFLKLDKCKKPKKTLCF